MSDEEKSKRRIQTTISNPRVIELFDMLKHGSRAMAIEQGLILLSKHRRGKELFFPSLAEKESVASKKAKETKKPEADTNTEPKQKIVTEW